MVGRNKAPLLALVATVWLPILAGCAGKIDRKSGGDAYRNEAKTIAPGKFVDDTLDHSAGDSTDWKSVEIVQPGKFVVALTSDPDAEIALGVYDKYGAPVGSAIKRKGSSKMVKVTVTAKGTGLYFIRIRAQNGGSITYSVKASLGGGGGGGGGPDLPDF